MFDAAFAGGSLMSTVTRILEQIRNGDGEAAERLIEAVYDELRRLAAADLARLEKLMKDPQNAANEEAKEFLAEARLVLGGFATEEE